MARGRLSGAAGYAIALVIVSVFFVLSLLLAIVFSTQINEAKAAQQAAESRLRDYIVPNEQTDPRVIELTQDNTYSVVGHLLNESRIKSQKITGNENSTIDMINRELEIAGLDKAGPLMAQLQRQLANVRDLQEQVDQQKADAQAAIERAKAIEAEKATLDAAFQAAVEKLESRVANMQQMNGQYEQTVDGARKLLEDRLAELQATLAKETADLRAIIDQKDIRIAELERRLGELVDVAVSEEGSTPVDPSRVPDGIIITVISDQPLVYVNIGSNDHVLLGMTFEVYDKNVGIVTDEFGTLRGKATIEISRVQAGSSLGRVVRREPGAIISEGDLIGNVAYDPNATLKFHVYGEFDIDNIGQATIGDRRRIEAMVTNWGGVVADKLSYDADFLVLGKEPELPEPLGDDVFDPKLIAEHAAMVQRYEQYQALILEAKSLTIPVLNQNRFLTMVGYYQR